MYKALNKLSEYIYTFTYQKNVTLYTFAACFQNS